MLGSIFSLILTIGSILFILMIKLRLLPLAAYVVLANTALRGWASANETLANITFFVILGLILASWIVTIVKRVCMIN